MLIIREEQIQHFIAADEDQLIKVIAGAIRRLNEKRIAGYDDEKLAKMIKTGIARARSHELIKAEDIAAFVALMFEIAPKFDEQAEIKAVLDDASFPPDERFYQLFERVSHNGWFEAETLYEAAFWFPADSTKKG
ncbi:MAG TPA: hypothetical protein VF692_08680 [Pyrinomonadaceae bacterium]